MAGNRPPRYYPVLTKRKIANTRNLIDKISNTSSLSGAEVVGVFESMRILIPELLGSGHNVRIDGLGTFSIHARSKGKDSPEDVTSKDIESLNISFLPDKDVKRMLQAIEFNKVK